MPKNRISLVNVPDDVSPADLRTFLRSEASSIQALAGHPDDRILVRLFVPAPVLVAIGQRELDAILLTIVNKNANIQRIELLEVERSLSIAAMATEQANAIQELESNPPSPPTIH